MPADLGARLELWARGIPHELTFWTHWARTGGASWPDDFAQRMNPQAPLAPWLVNWAKKLGLREFRLLDVGAGPVTSVGYTVPSGMSVDIVATDPLADAYNRIFDSLGVVRPVPSIFAPAEELSAFLPPDSFDIVHCRNALDHSFDPLRGVIEMLRLAKIGGVVVLYHNPNEAQSEDYSGFHQYNFDVQDDRFIIWRGETRFDVLEHMPVKVRMQSQKAGHVVVSIEKLEPFPAEEDSRFRQRFAESISAMMNLLIRNNLA